MVSYAVSNMEPTLFCLDGGSTCTVLNLFDCVINSCINNLFFCNNSVFHAVNKGNTDTAAAMSLDYSCFDSMGTVVEVTTTKD
mgnify:CR=1 FL=1